MGIIRPSLTPYSYRVMGINRPSCTSYSDRAMGWTCTAQGENNR